MKTSVCAVPSKDHQGDLHEWEIGKPGAGRIILCALHEGVYMKPHSKPRPTPCTCCVCREKVVLKGECDAERI